MNKYTLKDRQPILEPDISTWGDWMAIDDNRRVAITKIGNKTISTIFLGIDHNFYGNVDPILFETAVFKSDGIDGHCMERCCTWEEAQAQHKRVIKQVVKDKVTSHIPIALILIYLYLIIQVVVLLD